MMLSWIRSSVSKYKVGLKKYRKANPIKRIPLKVFFYFFFNFFFGFRSVWWKKNHAKEKIPECFKDGNPYAEQKMGWNIYAKEGTLYKNHLRKFHAIHYVFKYRIALPLILIIKKTVGKYLYKKVPDEPHNVFIKIFDESFEESLVDWNVCYLRTQSKKGFKKSIGYWKKQAKIEDTSVAYLRLMKEVVTTMALYDTAYREFLNILMINIANNVGKHLEDNKLKGVSHLFYTGTKAFNVHYYNLYQPIQGLDKIKGNDLTVMPAFKTKKDEDRNKQDFERNGTKHPLEI